MSSIEERLKKMEERKRRLEQEIRSLQARQRAERRKRETRKKILIGAMVLHLVETERWPEEKLRRLLDGYLTGERDRQLFDLPPREPERQDPAIRSVG